MTTTRMMNQAETIRELSSRELDDVSGGTLAGPLQPVVDATADAAVDVVGGAVAGGNGIITAVDQTITK